MEKIAFTVPRIESFTCIAGRDRTHYRDKNTDGLGVRVTNTGAKSYYFESKLNRQTIQLNIGKTSVWTLKEAQNEARRLKVLVDQGIDPRRERQENIEKNQVKREETSAALFEERRRKVTVSQAWTEYVNARKDKKSKFGSTWSKLHLKDHYYLSGLGGIDEARALEVKPNDNAPLAPLMSLTLGQINKKQMERWTVEQVEKRPTPAALSYRLFRAFLGWLETQDEYCGIVPTDALAEAKNNLVASSKRTQDTLERTHIAAWFKAALAMQNPYTRAFLISLLLTGARPHQEMATLKRTDLNHKHGGSMTLHNKTGGTRRIPLHPYLEQLYNDLPKPYTNEFIFYSKSATGYISPPTKAHERMLKDADLPHVTFHGLRRTFTNLARQAKVARIYTNKIQGHTPQDVDLQFYSEMTLDELRPEYDKIVDFILKEAGVEFKASKTQSGLRLIK